MHAAIAIAARDLLSLLRDRVGFFFTFAFPLILALLFGVVFSGSSGGPRDVRLGVVDLDATPTAAALIELLENDPKLTVSAIDTIEAADEAVRRGQQAGAVVIPEGFAADLEDLFFGGGAELLLTLDPARNLESGVIRGAVTSSAYRVMFEAFQGGAPGRRVLERGRESVESAELNPIERAVFRGFLGSLEQVLDLQDQNEPDDPDTAATPDGDADPAPFEPVRVTERPLGGEDAESAAAADAPATEAAGAPASPGKAARPDTAFEITFAQAVAWGLMSSVLGFGLGLVGERTRGTLARLRMAPIGPTTILLGKVLGCAITCIAVQVVILAIGISFLGVSPDSWLALGLAVACSVVAFVGIAMLLAAFGRTEIGSEGLSRAVLLVLALLGGAGVPLAMMPGWVRNLASISPFRWTIDALDGAIWRQYTPAEMAVPLLVLLGGGIVAFAAGVLLFRRSLD